MKILQVCLFSVILSTLGLIISEQFFKWGFRSKALQESQDVEL